MHMYIIIWLQPGSPCKPRCAFVRSLMKSFVWDPPSLLAGSWACKIKLFSWCMFYCGVTRPTGHPVFGSFSRFPSFPAWFPGFHIFPHPILSFHRFPVSPFPDLADFPEEAGNRDIRNGRVRSTCITGFRHFPLMLVIWNQNPVSQFSRGVFRFPVFPHTILQLYRCPVF